MDLICRLEVWIWVLIASVPDLCILITFFNVQYFYQYFMSRAILNSVYFRQSLMVNIIALLINNGSGL